LIEKLLLFAGAIQLAGEDKALGLFGGDELRASGARLQPPRHAGPPGTYRTLTAVDSAVMVLDALPAQTQGSINSSRQPAKSPTFRVARAAPRDRAMAAMRASASEIGRPARRRLAAISANSRAAALSNGNTRPFEHSGRRRWTQGLRQDVCVENDHVKSGGSRIAPRAGSDSSKPPKGSTLLRIASARFPACASSCDKAVRKMSRASSSIDRFRCAARSRNFRFTVSSRLRIVMLAMKWLL
jgi:hypothetical protein